MSKTRILDRVIKSLVRDYGYEKNEIAISVPIGRRHVADAVVYDSSDRHRILVVVEVKPKLVFLPSVIPQMEKYMDAANASFGLISNGVDNISLRRIRPGLFAPIRDIPKQGEKVSEFPKKTDLLERDDVEYRLWRIADIIRSDLGLSQADILDEIRKILVLKVIDERNQGRLNFWVTMTELAAQDSKAVDSLMSRIAVLTQRARQIDPDLLGEDDLRLDPNTLMKCVIEIQNSSLVRSSDSTARAFINLMLKGALGLKSWGEYYIPSTLVELMMEILDSNPVEPFLDPKCGAGSLLVGVLSHSHKKVKKCSDYGPAKIYGAERVLSAARTAKMNMILHGASPTNIFCEDSLHSGGSIDALSREIGGFAVVASAPPFGSFVTDPDLLARFEVAKGQRRCSVTALIIEKSWQWLRSGGRLAIVVPESLLFGRESRRIRHFILRRYTVNGILSLPFGLFYPNAQLKSNLLILERSDVQPDLSYPVLMALLTQTGAESLSERICEVSMVYRNFITGQPVKGEGIFVVRAEELGIKSWDVKSHLPLPEAFDTKGTRLQDLCRIIRGSYVSAKRYMATQASTEAEGIPYVRISDLSGNTIKKAGIKRIEAPPWPKKHTTLCAGDVLVSATGTIGKLALVPDEFEGSVPSSQIRVLRPDRSKVRSSYVLHMLSSEAVQAQLDRMATGAYIRHLPVSVLRELRIPVPSLETQDRIVEQVEALVREAKEHSRKSDETRKKVQRILKGAEV